MANGTRCRMASILPLQLSSILATAPAAIINLLDALSLSFIRLQIAMATYTLIDNNCRLRGVSLDGRKRETRPPLRQLRLGGRRSEGWVADGKSKRYEVEKPGYVKHYNSPYWITIFSRTDHLLFDIHRRGRRWWPPASVKNSSQILPPDTCLVLIYKGLRITT
jgi:hypothetical protein